MAEDDPHKGHDLKSRSKRDRGVYVFRMWCKTCKGWVDDHWHYGDSAKTDPWG